MAVPFSPMPSCSARSWPDWLAGTVRTARPATGGWFRPGSFWRSVSRPRSPRRICAGSVCLGRDQTAQAEETCDCGSALVPVLLWYLWANHLVEKGEGSRAWAENRAIWLAVPGFLALGRWDTLDEPREVLDRAGVLAARAASGGLGTEPAPGPWARSRHLAGVGRGGALHDGPAGRKAAPRVLLAVPGARRLRRGSAAAGAGSRTGIAVGHVPWCWFFSDRATFLCAPRGKSRRSGGIWNRRRRQFARSYRRTSGWSRPSPCFSRPTAGAAG